MKEERKTKGKNNNNKYKYKDFSVFLFLLFLFLFSCLVSLLFSPFSFLLSPFSSLFLSLLFSFLFSFLHYLSVFPLSPPFSFAYPFSFLFLKKTFYSGQAHFATCGSSVLSSPYKSEKFRYLCAKFGCLITGNFYLFIYFPFFSLVFFFLFLILLIFFFNY